MRIQQLAVLIPFSVALAVSAPPMIERLEPWGAQRGSAVRLTLVGQALDATVQLETTLPAAVTRLSKNADSVDGPSFLVEIPENSAIGRYPIRVRTEDGISNVLLFAVGEFPEVAEDESGAIEPNGLNDKLESAQVVKPPTTVQGRLIGPDRDYYQFHADAGQRLVFEADARRSGSGVDPHIAVVDMKGRTLARSSDASGLGADARTEVRFDQEGDYYVWIRDERFSLQAADFYRLTIAEYDYPSGVFPLGWRRGEEVEVEFFGGSLAAPQLTTIQVPDNVRFATRISAPGGPADLPFIVSDFPETIEPGGAEKTLPAGVVVNGRIAEAGEVDTYRLYVSKGENWAFELISAEAAASQLYGVLIIQDQDGKTLARAGTYEGDENLFRIIYTGQTGSSAYLNFAIPEGVTQLTLTVEDLLGRGGPGFSYRLSANQQPPDFLLSLNTPYVNVPKSGTAQVIVTAERRGYDGQIDITIPNAPEGILVEGGRIAPYARADSAPTRFERSVLTLTAKPGVEAGRFELDVIAQARLGDGTLIERKAEMPGLVTPITGDQPARADWMGASLAAAIAPEEPGALEFLTPRKLRVVFGGKQHTVRWKFTPRGSARLAKAVEVPRNAGTVRLRETKENSKRDQGEFQLFAHERTGLGPSDFQFQAEVSDGGRTTTVYSQPMVIDVVPGYSIDPPAEPIRISAGRDLKLSGDLRRDPEFPHPVTVRVENLPLGVECAEATLTPGDARYALDCKAEMSAQPGEYEVDLLATSQLSDEGTTPYDLEPLTAKLVVEGSQRAGR